MLLSTPRIVEKPSAHTPEGTVIKSTGEGGGTKYLREDGDGTSSWQTVTVDTTNLVTSVSGSTGAVSDGDIDHDSLANFAANEHFTQANITATGTIASGVWNGTAVDGTYVDIEGTEVKSTGEAGGTKFLREDGDGTSSWQTPSAHTPEGTAVISTGEAGGSKFLREDGDGTCSWQASPVTSVSGSTGAVVDGDIDHDSLLNFASNEHYTQANITATGTVASGTWQGTSIATTYTDAKVTSVSGSTGAVTDGDIDHDSLLNFAANEHFTQANITATGTVASGVWQGTAVNGAYVDIEGTEVKSTGEALGGLFLREDGDGTCSWQTPAGITNVVGLVEGTGVLSTGEAGGTKFLREDGDGSSSWQDVYLGLGTNNILTNTKIISENITFAGTENGVSVGEVAIANGYTVSVVNGSRWVVI